MHKRRAIIVGNKTVRPESGLPSLKGPANDISEMSRILGDPALGGSDTSVLADRTREEVSGAIELSLSELAKGDTLLIYFSGHGTLDFRGRLCLVTSNTEQKIIYSSSLVFDHIRDLVNDARCETVVIILDCCYAGRAANAKGTVEAQLHEAVNSTNGLYVLAGSGSTQHSLEEAEGNEEKVMGVFTSAIVNGIETGKADQDNDGQIGLRDLSKYTLDLLEHQRPRFLASGQGDPIIAPNRFPRVTDPDEWKNLKEYMVVIAQMLDEWSYKNLSRIVAGTIRSYRKSSSFDNELRILRDKALIIVPRGVSAIPDNGDNLMDFVQATPLGREVIRCTEEMRLWPMSKTAG